MVLVVFGFWETRAKSPHAPADASSRTSRSPGANLVGLTVSFGFFGVILFLSLFMQNVQGYSATGAGIRQLAATLAVMVVGRRLGPDRRPG